jgi:hypothetical protein
MHGETSERELSRLLEAGDDPGHLLLERCQHLRGAWMPL